MEQLIKLQKLLQEDHFKLKEHNAIGLFFVCK